MLYYKVVVKIFMFYLFLEFVLYRVVRGYCSNCICCYNYCFVSMCRCYVWRGFVFVFIC